MEWYWITLITLHIIGLILLIIGFILSELEDDVKSSTLVKTIALLMMLFWEISVPFSFYYTSRKKRKQAFK